MSRSIQVSLPTDETDKVIIRVRDLKGLIGLRVHRNVSIQPKGDVLELDLLNSEVNEFLKILEEEGLMIKDEVSITTNRPTNVISKSFSSQILAEKHESSWEDVLKNLLHESNMSLNTQMVMFFAGFIAAMGISSDTLHIVIGAMLIAPGFEPISRLAMGLVTQHRDWKNGAKDILKGYSFLVIGAVVAGLVLKFLGKEIFPGSSAYLHNGVLIDYWSNITEISLIVSVIASLAGGIIIMTNKSLLTAGVMVALALIPAATMIGLGLLEGDWNLVGTAAIRFLLEIGIVAFFTGIIFALKRFTTQKRNMKT